MAKPLTASKTRSNRPGWAITFRHPLRLDSQGKPGRKVRRGLGTDHDAEADRLVAQMNELLRDPSWWNANRRKEAEKHFSPSIVAAFFDDLQAGAESPDDLRENHLPMPGSEEGFSRVLFVGTTGAGKTTILRQLIGSDPYMDRFPSTAPAKTTIADIEVITAPGNYKSIVTFFSEFQVQVYIEECILEAAMAIHAGVKSERVIDRFLNHRDQKFRLSYILGSLTPSMEEANLEDDPFDDEEDDPDTVSEDDPLPQAEQIANRAALENIIDRIHGISLEISTSVSNLLEVDIEKVSKEDQDAFLELVGEAFEAELHSQEGFHELVQDILDLVRTRFSRLEGGVLHFGRSDWPQSWTLESDDREKFIRLIRWFSSNHWAHFGRLLTPIVNGIRIRGPLYAKGFPEGTKLVLIDGQGLGHTPDEASSVTTHITRRFAEVDVVLIVDNAQQPMQAAPISVLKALAISGYDEKLAIAFTHFDQIKGQNLRNMLDRRAHVMASVMIAISSLQDTVGAKIAKNLEKGIDDRCFMLGDTQKRLSSLKPKTSIYLKTQLEKLIHFFVEAGKPKEIAAAAVIYDPLGIPFAIQDGVSKFNGAWKARLGLGSYANMRKEHWTRIRALSKRVAGETGIEYDTLRPVADLQTRLLEAISRYLDTPSFESESEQEQRAATRARQLVAENLIKLSKERIVDRHLQAWRDAYGQRGHGSSARRANIIFNIYDKAAPTPGVIMSSEARDFLEQVTRVISKAVEAVGGKMQSNL